jgi:membrane-associated phospholipid phosphatase
MPMKYLTDSPARILFIRMSGWLTLVMLLVVCLLPKSVSFVAANPYHCHWMDVLFGIITNLGDGITALILIAYFFIIKNRPMAYTLLASFLLSGAIAQVMKRLFNAPRPSAFYPAGTYHYFIAGVTHSGWNSFPSGHAATAFALAYLLSGHMNCKKWCSVFFVLATAVVYSRIYLGQHFIEDTLAGMIIGVSSAVLTGVIYSRTILRRSLRQTAITEHESLSLEL